MRTWLFHPFSKLAGVVSLIIGIAAIVTTAMIGWWWHGVATDGVLELHFVATNDFFSYLVLGGIAWLTLSLCLLVVGHGLTSTQYRIVDLLGTQALARWPMLLATLVIGLPPYRRTLQESIMAVQSASGHASVDMAIVLGLSLMPLALTVWMVWLMYHSYKVVFNFKGPRGPWSFALTLAAAEIISKIAVSVLSSM